MKKLIIFLVLLFVSLFSLGWYDIKTGRNSLLGNYLPVEIKDFFKKTIFIIPNLQSQIVSKDIKIKNLSIEETKTLEIWKNIISNNVETIMATNISNETILLNNDKVIFSKFLLPLPSYKKWGQKSVGYIEENDDFFIFVTGDGKIFFFENDNLNQKLQKNNDKIKFFRVKSNLSIFNDGLGEIGKISIKDILLKDNRIFISHINEKKNDCHNIEIIKGDLNFKLVKFENFFSYDECFVRGNIHATGGRMVSFNNNEILFTTGEGLIKKGRPAQNSNSFFGKIFKININTKEFKLVSMGHRNPQGLFYDKESNIITSTEHGPAGGDEINIIKYSDKVANYGWPISSYGDHEPDDIDLYKRRGKLTEFLEEQPLYKSHSKYSFEEPIKFYKPSIGISEIIKLPKNLNKSFKDFYFVGSMGWNIEEGDKTLHYFRLNKKKDGIEKIGMTVIGERIRDLKYSKKNNMIIMVLENSPALGFISFNNS